MKVSTRIASIALLIALNSASFGAQAGGIAVSHYEPLQRMTLESAASIGSAKVGLNTPMAMSFDALGRTFELSLEPNGRLLSTDARVGLAGDIGVYRGRLQGRADSWVRIVIADGKPSGLIWDGEQLFAVESPGDSALSIEAPVIYRLADVLVQPGTMSCGSRSIAGNAAAGYQKLLAELDVAFAQGPGATRELSLGAAGDYEFTNGLGSGADAAIVARLNNVDGIFSQQLGVQLTVDTLETFADPADPFSDTLVANDLLADLTDYRVTTPSQAARGLTHLYTGRDLNTTTVGIAYRSALCSTNFGAGLSEARRGVTTDSLIAAHEIGHNFGAPHDGEAGSPCEAVVGDWIMSPSVSGVDQFSSCSITEMQDDIANAPCIRALPAVDVSIALNSMVSTVLQGTTTDIVYDIDNNGSLDASNVQANFTIPAQLTVNSVTASAGSCSMGSGTASCSLTDIPGFGASTVTLSVTGSTLGSGTMSATVTADADANANNNQQSVQIAVDAATDLRVFGTGTTTVTLDASTTVRPTLQNQSNMAATGVTVTITLSSGIRADSANWSLGSCTVASQQIDCQASSFAAQSSSAIDIGLTATETGSQSYTITVASNEGDTNTSNNTATGTVTVNAPGGGGGGGGSSSDDGGGSSGPLLLWMLGLTAALLRRGRKRPAA